MRSIRLRFTMRRMMVAVAIVALTIGGGIEAVRLRRLRSSHLDDAAYHSRREAEEARNIANFKRGRLGNASNANDRSILLMEQSSRLRVAYHAQLKRKYLEAADRPWSAVASDQKDPGEDLLWRAMMEVPKIEFDLPQFLQPHPPASPRSAP